MKYLKTVGFLFLFNILAISVQAQVKQNSELKKSEKKSYESWNKQQCLNHIEAIDKKAEYIKSNPEEYKIAQEQGWFKQAEQTKKELKARIEEIENQ